MNTQVVYSEPMAALRVRTLLACNRPNDALAAMEVHYEAPGCIKGAPWRGWMSVQARYHIGDLMVSVCAYVYVFMCVCLCECVSVLVHEVHYEAPACIRGAPWRGWMSVQARYPQKNLMVRLCAYVCVCLCECVSV